MAAIAPAYIPENPALLEALARGNRAEELFARLVRKNGGQIVCRATREQDAREHWDFQISGGGKALKVDVKAMKALFRGGPLQDRLVCCELHGSHPNNRGWLFGGQADLIAFQVHDGFILARRKALCNYLQANIDLTRLVSRSSDAVNGAVYNRRDSELVTWIHRSILFFPDILAGRLR